MKSRVSSQIDMALLSEGLSRPGIDPRIWVSYGVLTSEPYIETRNGKQDIFVDVQLLPSGAEETARVGAIYAGNGFGFYCPLHNNDEVLVLAPSGDPDEGLVITQRLWSPADPPPSSLSANPEDVTLVVETGKNLRLNVLGEGKVFLGNADASRGVARLNDTTANGTLKLTAIAVPSPPSPVPGVAITLSYTPPGGGAPMTSTVTLAVATLIAAVGSIDLSGKIDSASETVVSS